MSKNVLVEKHNSVWLVSINSPKKMNALDFEAHESLINIWKKFNDDDAARVAVITGVGENAFCSGADLKSYTMKFATTSAPEFRKEYVNGYGLGGITRGLEINKPLIAAINGYAISGGFEIALACDVRFCSPNARFGLQDSKWGFHACDGGLIRLPQIVGLGHAMDIILSGELIDSEEAYRIGLVNKVFSSKDLVSKAMDYAQMLSERAPLSHRLAKETIRRSVGQNLQEALKLEVSSFHDLGKSEDLKEGTTAFREKRKPGWVK